MARGERKIVRRSEESPEAKGAGAAAGEMKAGNVPVPAVSAPIPAAVFRSENWFPADTGGRMAMIRSMPSMTGRNNFCTCMVSLSSGYWLGRIGNKICPEVHLVP